MKNSIIYVCVILLLFLGTSCDHETIRADHEITSRTLNFTGYSVLKVSNAFQVYITFSDTEEKIIIEANNNIHDVIEVTKNGDILNIGLKKHINLRGDLTLKAYVTTKNLKEFDASGASYLELVNDLETDNVEIELSGASSLRGGLIVDHLQIEGSGASSFDLFGSVDRMDARLSGASNLKDFDLIINQLDLDLSGASNAYLTVKKSIDYRGSGASTLFYKGKAPIHSINISGASQIVTRD